MRFSISKASAAVLLAGTICFLLNATLDADELDYASLVKVPDEFTSVQIGPGQATLSSNKWSFLATEDEHANFDLSATVTIDEAATQFGFFGQSWSVWPDLTYGDQGFDAAMLLRAGTHDEPPGQRGYRVQLSYKYQHLALVNYPDGGYLASVPCEVKLNQPLRLDVRMQGDMIAVSVDGREKFVCRDRLLPITRGTVGIGSCSGAKVTWSGVSLVGRAASLPAINPNNRPVENQSHAANFWVASWLGDRPWVFDGNEPIMLLPTPDERYINNVKLRPGFKPLLSWNSHWGIENQGAFPEGDNRNSLIEVTGGGKTLRVSWTGRQKDGRFATNTTMDIGFDRDRQTYRYEIDSTLEVLGDKPFQFRYGYDFEHHTPLDPFRWQYLMVRREQERLTYRPLSPFDPGGMENVEQYHGARIWYGRTSNDFHVAPVVEYQIDPAWNGVADDKGIVRQRQMNTAVCAAFYDTGVAFAPDTAQPGTKVRVKYAYTGYSPQDAASFFDAAKIDDNPRNDPSHHFIFAREQWPTIRFGSFLEMDKPWWGGSPFMSGHNARPTYVLATLSDNDRQSISKLLADPATHAMKLGPQSYGIASPSAPASLSEGRYVVSAIVKSDNAHGPGGRIELLATERRDENGFVRMSSKILREETHYLGHGSFDWKRIAFVTLVPSGAPALALGLGNAGTGDVYVAEVSLLKLDEGSAIPNDVLAAAQPNPPEAPPALKGAIFDLRMLEQANHHVYNYGSGAARVLELCNAAWVVDEGRAAIKLVGSLVDGQPLAKRQSDYASGGNLEFTYLRHPSTAEARNNSFALAGHHGGGREYMAFSLVTWIKPAQQMEPAYWGTDILGFGARRVKLTLRNEKPPYALGVSLNFSDYLTSDVTLDADRWYHLAATGAATSDNKWLIRLYVDGLQVLESKSDKIDAPMSMPESLILGCELFYLNSAFYHGLIGRTLVLDRVLSPEEIAELAASKS